MRAGDGDDTLMNLPKPPWFMVACYLLAITLIVNSYKDTIPFEFEV